jgi:hypothetical protein
MIRYVARTLVSAVSRLISTPSPSEPSVGKSADAARRSACATTLLAALAASFAYAQSTPRIIFTKTFPGSDPAYVAVTVDRGGMVSYKETPDDDPDTFQLEPLFTDKVFALAGKLDHFKRPIESNLKNIANMGAKTFRWEDTAETAEIKFNYSTDQSAKDLWDFFELVTQSQRVYLELKRTVRHDKLGVWDALQKITDLWTDARLVGTPQFLPLFDRVAGDDTYIHMARQRAAELAEAVRAWSTK